MKVQGNTTLLNRIDGTITQADLERLVHATLTLPKGAVVSVEPAEVKLTITWTDQSLGKLADVPAGAANAARAQAGQAAQAAAAQAAAPSAELDGGAPSE